MKENVYLIDNQEFVLRPQEDISLEEDEQIQSIFSNFCAPDKKTISGTMTYEDITQLFELILEPVKKIPTNFNYRKVKRGVLAKIIADFFLASVLSPLKLAIGSKDSMKEQIERSMNMNS